MNLELLAGFVASVTVFLMTLGPVILMVANIAQKRGMGPAFDHSRHKYRLFVLDVATFLGAVHLIYFGYDIPKDELHPSSQTQEAPATDGGFWHGFLVGISNPKDVLSFSSSFCRSFLVSIRIYRPQAPSPH